MKAHLAKVSLNAMKRLAYIALAVLVLAACQDAVKPELTTPGVSLAYQGAPVSTLIVTKTNDAGPGSLRQAILDANGRAGTDLIAFNIPAATDARCNAGTGICTIQPASNLPSITDPVVIDGYTQPGASPNTNTIESKLGLNTVLKIEIDGSLIEGIDAAALVIHSPNITVRGLVINRVYSATATHTSGWGIRQISSGIGNNIIEGNFFGTDVTGTMALRNRNAVDIGTSNNRIGGTTPAARNLISGNFAGLQILGAAAGNVVQGNLIGTDVTGTVALGNETTGVGLLCCGTHNNNLVGGTAPGARNVISGNGGGVSIGVTNGNRVEGNFIGTDITGTLALTNGVSIGGAHDNIIGGTAPGAGNVIQGGVSIGQGSTGNRVEGNFIGTDETGSIDLGNLDRGVTIFESSGNTIGGTSPGAGNIIAYNREAGVWVRTAASTGNAILSNAIFANVAGAGRIGLGIDLGPGFGSDGVTSNDPGDGDTGANNFQNFPVVSSSFTRGGIVTVEGTLNSTSSTAFRLEFFANQVRDPSGHGEGETFLGFTTVTTDASGDAGFKATFSARVPAGQFITATATDPANNTSEFSGVETAEPGSLCDDVADLITAGVLNRGQGNSLITTCEAAFRQLDRGNTNAAINQLNAFINEVTAFINGGILSPAEGQALIDAAQTIIDVVSV